MYLPDRFPVSGLGSAPFFHDQLQRKEYIAMPGNNLVTAMISVRGVRPLPWHHFSEDSLPLETCLSKGIPGGARGGSIRAEEMSMPTVFYKHEELLRPIPNWGGHGKPPVQDAATCAGV